MYITYQFKGHSTIHIMDNATPVQFKPYNTSVYKIVVIASQI